MRTVANAEQTFAGPVSQPVDLDGEQFDFRPIVQLCDSVLEKGAEFDNVAMQCAQAARLHLVEATFWNDKTDLKIIAAVEQNEELPVAKESERLLGIAVALGKAHPEHVDRCAKIAELEFTSRMRDGMPAVGPDDEISEKIAFVVRSLRAHPRDATVFKNKIDNFMLHVERERGEAFGVRRKKVQKIPLRHERDEFAARAQTREIRDRDGVAVEISSDLAQFLMRQLEKLLQQPELVHELEGGRMNGVAAKIAVEIGVFLQHDHVHTGARQQVTAHHSSRSATDDDATNADESRRFHGIWKSIVASRHRTGIRVVFLEEENDRKNMVKKMRAVQVTEPKGPFEIVEREIPEPQARWVRIKIHACGICHSDSLVKDGTWPGIQYPRIPGHEVIGVIDALGADVAEWKSGQRVGVGWHAGHCGHCDHCRRGDFFACSVALLTTGISFDGGYAEYMTAPATALASVPKDLSSVESAPLMCAGITTFNALRNSGARPGDVVAVLGVGGLGHLGVQFAAKMGFKTVAIARGKDKGPLAKKLGAVHYVDSQEKDPAAELMKLGGAKVVIATVTNADAMSAVLGGLSPNGVLVVIGAAGPLSVDPILLISGQRSVKGWYSGTSIDSQDTLKFSALAGVQSMNEIFPLEKASEAYERMMSGKARFRVVLSMESKAAN